jgi:hypothetical protein
LGIWQKYVLSGVQSSRPIITFPKSIVRLFFLSYNPLADSNLGTLQARAIEHEHFHLKEVLNSELKQAKEMMDAIPGGRRATTVTTDEDFSLAVKRLKYLREYR